MIQVVARRRDDERGFTIVFVALTIVVMLTFVAFAVDLGNAKQKRRNAQNAADGAALAAARDLTNVSLAMSVRESTAVATAKSYVAGTYGAVTWTGCTDSSHLTDTPDAASTNECISFSSSPLEVRVRLPIDDVPTAFAGVVGVRSIPVRAAAAAKVSSPFTLRIIPDAVTTADGTGNLCIENSGSDTSCKKRTSGNFGDLQSPRFMRFTVDANNNDDALRINYMMGLDHFIEAWGSGSPPRTTKICDGDMKNPPCTTSNVTDNTLIANYMNTNTGNNTNELGDGLLGNIWNGTNAGTMNIPTNDAGPTRFCGRLVRPDITDENVSDPNPTGCDAAGTTDRPTTIILDRNASARHIAAYMTSAALSYFYGTSGTPPQVDHPGNYDTSPYSDKSPSNPSKTRDDDLDCFLAAYKSTPSDNRIAAATGCGLSSGVPSGPMFNATIANDPRWGFIPILAAFPSGGSNAEEIAGFWAAFIYRAYTTSSNIKAIDSWVFDPALIEGAPSTSVGGGADFLGGPAVISLVQ